MTPTAELLLPEVEELLSEGLYTELRDALAAIHPADIADILAEIDLAKGAVAFRFLQRDDAAAVFSYLSPERQEELIKELGTEGSARVLEVMRPDDRARLIDELPEDIAQRVMSGLSPEERRATQAILGYPEGSVGRLMTPDYVRIRPQWSVAQALDHVRKYGKDAETIAYVYVIDNEGRLVDDLRLRALLLANPEDTVETHMNRSFVKLRATDDQDEAVATMARYDRFALPVVDSRDVLIGIVTSDDVADVAQQQATEEIQKIGGLEALDEPYMATPLALLIRKRVTWLAVLFIGEMFTASALGFFEHELERTVILSLFIPLIVSSGGNSGSQAASLIIRALALREITLRDWWRVLRRELVAGAILGAILGALGLVRIHVWQWAGLANYTVHFHLVALTIMCAVFGIVMWGCIVGAMLPFVLKRVKLDPATSSAPFVATLVDVTGIIIYLTSAMLILRTTLLAPDRFVQEPMPGGTAEAQVRSAMADPRGEPFMYVVVQSAAQRESGTSSRLKIPLAGMPGGRLPQAGDVVRVHLAAEEASSLEYVEPGPKGDR